MLNIELSIMVKRNEKSRIIRNMNGLRNLQCLRLSKTFLQEQRILNGNIEYLDLVVELLLMTVEV